MALRISATPSRLHDVNGDAITILEQCCSDTAVLAGSHCSMSQAEWTCRYLPVKLLRAASHLDLAFGQGYVVYRPAICAHSEPCPVH